MPSDLRWNPIQANFSGANQAMGNAQQGLSQAGTIFSNFAKDIQAQEQQELDNAFRQLQFAEQLREYDQNYQLDTKKFIEDTRDRFLGRSIDMANSNEQMRSNKANEGLKAREIAQQLQIARERINAERELTLLKGQQDRELEEWKYKNNPDYSKKLNDAFLSNIKGMANTYGNTKDPEQKKRMLNEAFINSKSGNLPEYQTRMWGELLRAYNTIDQADIYSADLAKQIFDTLDAASGNNSGVNNLAQGQADATRAAQEADLRFKEAINNDSYTALQYTNEKLTEQKDRDQVSQYVDSIVESLDAKGRIHVSKAKLTEMLLNNIDIEDGKLVENIDPNDAKLRATLLNAIIYGQVPIFDIDPKYGKNQAEALLRQQQPERLPLWQEALKQEIDEARTENNNKKTAAIRAANRGSGSAYFVDPTTGIANFNTSRNFPNYREMALQAALQQAIFQAQSDRVLKSIPY